MKLSAKVAIMAEAGSGVGEVTARVLAEQGASVVIVDRDRNIGESEADWDSVHNMNLKGSFLGCKHVIPAMIRRGGGSIINVASVLRFVGDPDLADYCVAKGGVIALTRVAALTYGPQHVRVNCICPGDVASEDLRDPTGGQALEANLRVQSRKRGFSKFQFSSFGGSR